MHAVIRRVPTLFLKTAIIGIGVLVLIFCGAMFPLMWTEILKPPQYTSMIVAFVALSVSPIPFYIALYQGFRLLQLIDANNAFSESSIRALRNITACAVAMSLLYAACMPLAWLVAELDDAPGVIVVGGVITGTALVVAVFSAVLQTLVASALAMKTEHDFTI